MNKVHSTGVANPVVGVATGLSASVITDAQIMDAVRHFASDGGRWPSDWIAACRAVLALAPVDAAQPASSSAPAVGGVTLFDRRKDHGYAPGDYMCKCRRCGSMFQGDKRAWCCESCADKAIASPVAPSLDEPTEAMVNAMVRRMFSEKNYRAPWEDVMRLAYMDARALAAQGDGGTAE